MLSCQNGRADSFLQATDRSAIRQLAAERLSEYYVKEGRDIFSELPEKDYVIDLSKLKPEYLGKLLLRFERMFTSSKDLVFPLDKFCHIYDPQVITALLDRYGDSAFSNSEEQEAAERFRQAYALRQGAQGTNKGELHSADA